MRRVIDRTKTYEQLVVERMDEIKAMAATGTTYGDWSRLKEEIEDERGEIREYILKSHTRIRSHDRAIERDQRGSLRRGVPVDLNSIWHRFRARAQRRLNFERAIRDELTEGLREHRRQDREDTLVRQRILKEWENEKEARA